MIRYSLVSTGKLGNCEIPWLDKFSGSDIDQHVPGDTLYGSGVSRLSELNSIMYMQTGEDASKPMANHRKGKRYKRKKEKHFTWKCRLNFKETNLTFFNDPLPPKFRCSLANLHKPGCLWSGGEKWLFPAATDAWSATWWQQFSFWEVGGMNGAMGILRGAVSAWDGRHFPNPKWDIFYHISSFEYPNAAVSLTKLCWSRHETTTSPKTRRFKLALHSQQAEKLVKPKGLVYLTVGPGVLVVMDCYGCWLGCGMFRMRSPLSH